MPCISGRYDPVVGALTPVAIMALPAEPESSQVVETQAKLSIFQALIDTGATSTCVTQKVVDAVGLVANGKAMMAGATGDREVDLFAFGVGF